MADHSTDFPGTGDFRPTASLAMLRIRASLLSALRRFFERHGYLEVETPLLSRDIVVDAHLEPFVTHWRPEGHSAAESVPPGAGARRGVELFLQTSPEFGMKRLLAAGATAICQVTRSFRNGEVGRRHNPEFTLVEWYRAGDSHHDQMDFTESLVAELFAAASELTSCPKQKADTLQVEEPDPVFGQPHASHPRSLERPFDRLTYDDAFQRFAGQRVLDLTPAELQELARQHGMAPPPGLAANDRDGWLNLLLAELVEPHLGTGRPVFLYDYPASQGALARRRPDDPRVAERFELYIDRIELANGYHELLDAAELRTRIQEQSAVRRREGRRDLPGESRLLAAMESGLPACAGVALGFDRLMMAAVGATSLAEVMAFPFERA